MHIKRHMWKADLQIVLVAVLALCAATLIPVDSAQAGFKVLHAFDALDRSDGNNPTGALTRKAHILYGATENGGTYDFGSVFRLAPDGTESLLHSFTGADGAYPHGGLIMDTLGNLFGTTSSGGTDDDGTVFKLAPDGTLATLYTFTGGSDGADPEGVIADKVGNLYGTTQVGGAYNVGMVFKLAPDGALTTLYSFTGGSDGRYPAAGLIMDRAGNFYSTTQQGGASNYGNVFKLRPDGTLTTLYSFKGGTDGEFPLAGLVMDGDKNLYGTTNLGGIGNFGTVFKVTQRGEETVLHSFTGGDGRSPQGGVIMDKGGNLYGTAAGGGDHDVGVMYELSVDGAFSVLHSFDGKDGGAPNGSLIMGHRGKLYGTARLYGRHLGGTVFSLLRNDLAAASEDER